MAVYRITRFASSDMDRAGGAEDMRDARFIDLVSYGNGKAVFIAKYLE